MKLYFIEIGIAIMFSSMDVMAQSSIEAAVQAKKDVMNDTYFKDVLGGSNSSSKSSEVSYYNSQSNKIETVSSKEMYDNVKRELDEQWNSGSSESYEVDRGKSSDYLQLHRNDNYDPNTQNDLQASEETYPNSSQNMVINRKVFQSLNKQLMGNLKGMSFGKRIKLKNIDICSGEKQNEHKPACITNTINANIGNNNLHSKSKVDNVIIAIKENDVYLGKTYESLSEKEKRRLMLIERQRFTFTDPVAYDTPTLFESLHQTFIAPLVDVKNEIEAYTSMGPQGVWKELKATVSDEYFEDFYTGMQSQGIEEIKNAPLKKSIAYISKRIRKVVISFGETGERLLSTYDSYKRAKDIGNTQNGILIKVFSTLSNGDIDNFSQLSEELTKDVSKSTYKLAHRNAGLPYVPISEDEIQSYTADLFINKIPQEATEKILFR